MCPVFGIVYSTWVESRAHAFTIWDCKLMQSINFREAFRTFDFVCLILLLFPWANPRKASTLVFVVRLLSGRKIQIKQDL